MENNLIKRKKRRFKRAMRVRVHVKGNAEKPRLTVHKGNRNLYVQLIDDEAGVTLASAGTYSKKAKAKSNKSKDVAKEIGQKIAGLAKEKKISNVVFDRGRYKFHGIVAEIANGAREGGLVF